MEKHSFFGSALFLTFALFWTNTLSAQWNQNAASIWNSNLNQNVGIGTSTPISKLQINGGDKISIGFGDGNTYEGIGSKRTAGGNQWGLDFYTSGANRLSIKNNGYVGIGTINPTAKLQVDQGNLHLDSGYGIEFGDQNSYLPSHSKIWENVSTGHLIIRSGGHTTFTEGPGPFYPSPGHLELQGNVFVHSPGPGSENASLFLGDPASGESIKSRRAGYGNKYGLDFYTASTNRMSITQNGNVGVGTTSAIQKLQVNGGDNISIGFGDGSTYEGIGSKRSAGGNRWGLDFYTSGVNRLSITNNGYVGIGTSSPLFQLDINGITRCHALLQISDGRYKTNIKILDGALSKILAMRGTSYNFAADQLSKGFSADKQVGFIAQEMKNVMPELVKEDANGMLAINYIGVIPVLVEAFKEQHEVITEKETRIAALETQNSELQRRLTRIEAALGITTDPQADTKATTASAKVSPNPTSGLVTIDLQHTAVAKTVTVKIMDAAGREVAARTATARERSIQFDLTQFPSGAYVAQIIADGKMIGGNKIQMIK